MDAQRAVAKGYLPKEVPPVFSSATFAQAAYALTQAKAHRGKWIDEVQLGTGWRAATPRRASESLRAPPTSRPVRSKLGKAAVAYSS
jgi:hypothetical protein